MSQQLASGRLLARSEARRPYGHHVWALDSRAYLVLDTLFAAQLPPLSETGVLSTPARTVVRSELTRSDSSNITLGHEALRMLATALSPAPRMLHGTQARELTPSPSADPFLWGVVDDPSSVPAPMLQRLLLVLLGSYAIEACNYALVGESGDGSQTSPETQEKQLGRLYAMRDILEDHLEVHPACIDPYLELVLDLRTQIFVACNNLQPDAELHLRNLDGPLASRAHCFTSEHATQFKRMAAERSKAIHQELESTDGELSVRGAQDFVGFSTDLAVFIAVHGSFLKRQYPPLRVRDLARHAEKNNRVARWFVYRDEPAFSDRDQDDDGNRGSDSDDQDARDGPSTRSSQARTQIARNSQARDGDASHRQPEQLPNGTGVVSPNRSVAGRHPSPPQKRRRALPETIVGTLPQPNNRLPRSNGISRISPGPRSEHSSDSEHQPFVKVEGDAGGSGNADHHRRGSTSHRETSDVDQNVPLSYMHVFRRTSTLVSGQYGQELHQLETELRDIEARRSEIIARVLEIMHRAAQASDAGDSRASGDNEAPSGDQGQMNPDSDRSAGPASGGDDAAAGQVPIADSEAGGSEQPHDAGEASLQRSQEDAVSVSVDSEDELLPEMPSEAALPSAAELSVQEVGASSSEVAAAEAEDADGATQGDGIERGTVESSEPPAFDVLANGDAEQQGGGVPSAQSQTPIQHNSLDTSSQRSQENVAPSQGIATEMAENEWLVAAIWRHNGVAQHIMKDFRDPKHGFKHLGNNKMRNRIMAIKESINFVRR
ncbi:hypothetical protein HK105_204397 [Polyrhizophydium stewartii]|uniref:Uncharacterized protein n=1 Tax=Polyrhizophydium stewartii TaxID=2732419 RepID=A0ABR4N8W6_9FUNG